MSNALTSIDPYKVKDGLIDTLPLSFRQVNSPSWNPINPAHEPLT